MAKPAKIDTTKRDEDLWMECFKLLLEIPMQNGRTQSHPVKLTGKNITDLIDAAQKIYEGAKTANCTAFFEGLNALAGVGENEEDVF